jgi:DNA polymerase (family X)
MSSDSHSSSNLGKMEYGARQLKRAWLTKEDVLNTLDAEGFLAGLRKRP